MLGRSDAAGSWSRRLRHGVLPVADVGRRRNRCSRGGLRTSLPLRCRHSCGRSNRGATPKPSPSRLSTTSRERQRRSASADRSGAAPQRRAHQPTTAADRCQKRARARDSSACRKRRTHFAAQRWPVSVAIRVEIVMGATVLSSAVVRLSRTARLVVWPSEPPVPESRPG